MTQHYTQTTNIWQHLKQLSKKANIKEAVRAALLLMENTQVINQVWLKL